MSEVKRWFVFESDLDEWYPDPEYIRPVVIKYSDHLAAMEALQKRVQELEEAISKCSSAISGHHEVIAVEKIIRIIKKVSKEPK